LFALEIFFLVKSAPRVFLYLFWPLILLISQLNFGT
jgi:hypothetical protein